MSATLRDGDASGAGAGASSSAQQVSPCSVSPQLVAPASAGGAQPPPPHSRAPQVEKRVVIVPDKEELVASSPAQRNWRGILIALLVIVAVLGLIMFSIVLLSPPDEGPRVRGEKFCIRDLTENIFRALPFNGTWVNDVELVYRDADNGLSVLNSENLSTRVLMTNSTVRQVNAVDFKVSRDLKYVLLISEKRQVFDYSFEAKYTVFEVATQNRYSLRANDSDEDPQHAWLQLAEWGPSGSQLVLVLDNDIYYKANASIQARTLRLTSTGRRGVVYNGIPDWLYEVEILRRPSAVWFSPDSNYLLFASFNDTQVGELKYPWYGSLREGLKYPKIRSLRYPKAGTPNPEVALRLLALDNAASAPVELKPPPCISNSANDYYFTAVTWLSNGSLSIVWMNRRQNLSCISVCSWSSWNCDDVYQDRSEQWVDLYQAPVFSSDGSQLVARLPVNDGDQGSFRHVVQVAVRPLGTEALAVHPLTHGKMHVTDVLAWDQDNHVVYFLAAPALSPDQRHLYRVPDASAASPSSNPNWLCLTCPPRPPPSYGMDLLVQDGDLPLPSTTTPTPVTLNTTSLNETIWDWQWGSPSSAVCLFSNAHFPLSSNPRFYVLECLGPEVPHTILVDASSNIPILTLQSNSHLRELYAKRARPQVKTFQVQIDHDYHAQVRLLLPPGLRDYEDVAFPMVLHVNGAPGSQLVSQRWGVDWSVYLASNKNFIVAEIDGRGSGYQSDRFLHEPYMRLGSVELEDQIAVIKYLSENLKFVDRERIGVWGRGYGGFATAMILSQDLGVFSCGISVAPITSWAHYDSIFSERYLRTPNVTDNYRGYEEADVTKKAGNLRDKRFMLIHGTADLRAHYVQTMLLVRALAKEGALFQHQTYPDEGHDLAGVREHLYRVMDSFWDDCFGPLDLEDWEEGIGLFSFKQ